MTLGEVPGLRTIQTGPFGTQLKAGEYDESGSGAPVVSVGEIRDGFIRIRPETPRVGPEVQSRLRHFMLDERDVVVSRKGTVDRSAWISQSYGPLFLGSDAIAVRFNDPETARFYSYVLQERTVREWLVRHAPGTTMLSMNGAVLGSVPVLSLDSARMSGTVELLGSLDDKIAANNCAINLGRELLREVWRSGADESSRKVRFGDVVAVNPHVTKSEQVEPAYVDMKALPERGLLIPKAGRREAKGGARFMRGDTLMARITPCFENGKMAYVDVLEDGEVGYGSTEFIVFRSLGGVPSAVAYAVVSSAEFREFAARSMVGTSGRQRVQAKGLDEYELDWPDDERLAEFGEFSEALLGRLGAARDENRRLAATRDELLPLLMSGKITVKDAEKTVEEVV